MVRVAVIAMGLGCAVPQSPRLNAPAEAKAVSSRSASPPAPASALPSASASASPAAPPPALEIAYAHPKLGFTFRYPSFLTRKDDSAGVTLTSKALGKGYDGVTGEPFDAAFAARIKLEPVGLIALVKKTNPTFAASFPAGNEASFKPEKDFAEIVMVGATAAYRFSLGSHSAQEVDTFVPAGPNKTLFVRCSIASEMSNPSWPEAEQRAACARIVATLTL